MHKITFYPIGNADCFKIDLDNGRKLVFDYAHTDASESQDDKRMDLAVALKEDLDNDECSKLDVLGFTHADSDHVGNASEFFWFDYAKSYQGEGRIKFTELWVPAAFILETGLSGDAMVIQKEAKHRLKAGYGVKIFSRPEKLKEWLEGEGIDFEDRKKFLVDAGKLVDSFSLTNDNVEFFVHSPFAKHTEEGTIDRNEASLIFNVLFTMGGRETRFMLIGDTEHEVLTEIVDITKYHKNEKRLSWDIYDIPHHCSYLALNSEKGETKTDPVENVKWLLDQGQYRGILVSSSNVLTDEDTTQPPHKQAAEYYKEVASNITGKFKVTMEHPKKEKPERLVILIDAYGARVETLFAAGSLNITRSTSPRAGK